MDEKHDNSLFINRELSWLEFNRRVLDLSRAKHVPLGEQLNFSAIYCSNLDEFFMVRVGSLFDQTLLKSEFKENKTNMTAKQQLAAIMPAVEDLQKSCDKDVNRLFGKLEKHNIVKVDFDSLTKDAQGFWKKYFRSELYPVLSPQIVDRRHPFPFLRNGEIYIGALMEDAKSNKKLFGLIPVSAQFERLVLFKDGDITYYALVEELIHHYASLVFGKVNIKETCIFRVTRNADIDIQEAMFDQDVDYRDIMSELLKKRRKLAAVRLQIYGMPTDELVGYIQEKLMLPEDQCFTQNTPLELSFMRKLSSMLEKLDLPELFYPNAKPIVPPQEYDLYQLVRTRDELICYPYQSMRPFIRMLFMAANDPDVISIKMTLYRLASESKIVEALIAAAENGKEVVTIVELRARFDEQNNIDWSKALENAGCTVIYGFTDYKVHSKLTLITRKTKSGFEYISQIGTGNYNEKTSELYTDLAFVTGNTEIGEEVGGVFNDLALEQPTENVKNLIVAPKNFKTVLMGEIEAETEYQKSGSKGRIIIKCNSISDKDIIETLSKASKAGVDTDIIVRGICCLRAGVPNVSDNIKVRSIVGRYLEHSRIYSFGEGERLRIYIASGDFLTRNTERRVEVGVRIDDPQIKKILSDILEMQLADNVNAKEMGIDGKYTQPKGQKDLPAVDSQMDSYFYVEGLMAKMYDGVYVKSGIGENSRHHELPKDLQMTSKTKGLKKKIKRFFSGFTK